MDDKKITQSITLVGGLLTALLTALIGFGVLPEGSESAAGGIVGGLVTCAQSIFALITLYGIRRKLGENPTQ